MCYGLAAPGPCRCTFTIVASTIAYSMSVARSLHRTDVGTHRPTQSCCLNTVFHLPNSGGKVSPGLPVCGQSILPHRSGGCLCRCVQITLFAKALKAPSWPIARLSVPIECSCAYCITALRAVVLDSQRFEPEHGSARCGAAYRQHRRGMACVMAREAGLSCRSAHGRLPAAPPGLFSSGAQQRWPP